MGEKLGASFVFLMKLLPAVVIFTLFLSFEGHLRWLAVLGFIPLVLAFCNSCTACMLEPDEHRKESSWHPGTGL